MEELLAKYRDLELVGFLYNTCFGGFSLSDAFMKRLNQLRVENGLQPFDKYWSPEDNERTDPLLIQVFQELGERASSGPLSSLRIKWIPKNFLYEVDMREYDGKETVTIDYQKVKCMIVDNYLYGWRQDPAMFPVQMLNKNIERFEKNKQRYEEFMKEWYAIKDISLTHS